MAVAEGFVYVVAPKTGTLLKFSEAELLDPSVIDPLPRMIFLGAESTDTPFPSSVAVMAPASGGVRRAYVPLMGTDQLTYVGIADDVRGPIVDLPLEGATSLRPSSIAARKKGDHVFVGNSLGGSISKVRGSDLVTEKTIPAGGFLGRVALQASATSFGFVETALSELANATESAFVAPQFQGALVGETTALLEIVERGNAAPAAVEAQAGNLVRNLERHSDDAHLVESVRVALDSAVLLYRVEAGGE